LTYTNSILFIQKERRCGSISTIDKKGGENLGKISTQTIK